MTMKKYLVGVQVIKVYHIEVEAEDDDEAMHNAYELSSSHIEEEGKLHLVEVDHPAIIEEIE